MQNRPTSLLVRAFRSLMPRDHQFIDQFTEHSRLLVPAAESFRALMSGDGLVHQHMTEIGRLEEAADRITRETILAIHRSFVTPFDRSQILDLITALDDTIDLMKETGRRISLYEVGFTAEMKAMADCIVCAAKELRDGMPLLGDID